MKKNLFIEAIAKFSAGVILVGLLIFLPAGSLTFWQGWLLMGILFVPMFAAGLVMLKKSPDLLAKRLDAKEKKDKQKGVVGFSGLMFLAGFILAGLDFRFGWIELPIWVPIVFSIVFLAGYVMYAFVLKQNAYLSRTIRVEEGQQVIDTGLYAMVRHPMYSATLLLFLSMPLVLGSLVSFFVFLIYPVLIVIRLKDEEALLRRELHGYEDYCKRVKYRLLPYIY